MKVLRWIFFIPVALLSGVIIGGLGDIVWRFFGWQGFLMEIASGFLLASTYLLGGLLAMPHDSRVAEAILMILGLILGVGLMVVHYLADNPWYDYIAPVSFFVSIIIMSYKLIIDK